MDIKQSLFFRVALMEKIDASLMKDAMYLRTGMQRVERFTDILRTALLKAPIGRYNGGPYCFNGEVYCPVDYDEFSNTIYDIAKYYNLPDGDYCKLEYTSRVLRRALAMKELVVDSKYIAFQNGVFDMESQSFGAFSASKQVVSQLPYKYDKFARAYKWKEFLDDVLPDEKMQKVLQEYVGALFIDRKVHKIENMCILLGSGSNGKGVVFEAVTGMVGSNNVTTFGLGEVMGGADRKKCLADMNGKKLNYCSEIQAMELGRYSDSLKAIISGEPVPARQMYCENFIARDLPMIMANANKLPSLKDWSEGMRRRLIIIPFNVTVPPSMQDLSLSVKIAAEYSGIFNWAMEGRQRFLAQGCHFSGSKEIRDVIDEYQGESNTVLKFMFRMGYYNAFRAQDGETPAFIKSTNLYKKYRKWCDDNGELAETQRAFAGVMTSAGYKRHKDSKGIYYCVYGIKLTTKSALFVAPKVMRKNANESNTFVVDGKTWIKTKVALADHFHISKTMLNDIEKKGLLKGVSFKQGLCIYYDVAAVRRVLIDNDYIGLTDDQRMQAKVDRELMAKERKSFNLRMINLGYPFRKAVIRKSDKYVYVADDWVFDPKTADRLLIKEHCKLNENGVWVKEMGSSANN